MFIKNIVILTTILVVTPLISGEIMFPQTLQGPLVGQMRDLGEMIDGILVMSELRLEAKVEGRVARRVCAHELQELDRAEASCGGLQNLLLLYIGWAQGLIAQWKSEEDDNQEPIDFVMRIQETHVEILKQLRSRVEVLRSAVNNLQPRRLFPFVPQAPKQ